MRVGLGGGLGAGKSTVGRLLAALGAVVIDTDQVARDVLAPGSPGERAVLERFGPSVATQDGSLDRQALADIVFAVPSDRLALEAITHPLIRREVEARLMSLDAGGLPGAGGQGPAIVVIEIPLLDRARRHDYHLDTVVVVEAPEELAIKRAEGRGIPPEQAKARTAAQPPPAERRAAADLVIMNTGNLLDLSAQVNHVVWPQLLHKVALQRTLRAHGAPRAGEEPQKPTDVSPE